MWVKPGVAATASIDNDKFQAKQLLIGSRTLRDVSQDYVLLNPFVFSAVFPNAPVDLITESMKTINRPTQHLAVITDKLLFDYGHEASQLGIPGNVCVVIPRHEWEDVQAFLHSMVFAIPTSWRVAIRTQTLSVIDPLANQSRPVADIATECVQITSVVLDMGKQAVVASVNDVAVPRYLRYRMVNVDDDTYLNAVCDAFFAGNSDPLTEAQTRIQSAAEDS